MSVPQEAPETITPETEVERRKFLERAGKYALVTPPAISAMLTASTVPAYATGSHSHGEKKGKKKGRRRRRR
jgi:hypothetical protein